MLGAHGSKMTIPRPFLCCLLALPLCICLCSCSTSRTTARSLLPATAFIEAVAAGDLSTVKGLLDKYPSLANTNYDTRPLPIAIRHRHIEIVEFLLARGVDPQSTDDYGWAPLHHAASDGLPDVARLLIRAGADVNQRGHQEESPLHWAVNNNQVGMIRFLVNNGARINLTDSLGRTPLDIALKWNLRPSQEALSHCGAVTSAELAKAYDWTGSGKTIDMLQRYSRLANATCANASLEPAKDDK